nr:MAG TPA: hypothetical protein [Caudoviricetes sp.]
MHPYRHCFQSDRSVAITAQALIKVRTIESRRSAPATTARKVRNSWA